MKNALFSTAYLPPVSWMAAFLKADDAVIEKHETYPKQTYRNRCKIITSQGLLSLSIPVIKTNVNHTQTADIKIDYSQPWQRTHWHAIETAYNRTPYFLYYRDYFEHCYQQKTPFLIDFNHNLLLQVLKCCGYKNHPFKYTSEYVKATDMEDLRTHFSPKANTPHIPRYMQAFEDTLGFIEDASIIDLLFNSGTDTVNYLKKTEYKRT